MKDLFPYQKIVFLLPEKVQRLLRLVDKFLWLGIGEANNWNRTGYTGQLLGVE